MNELSKETWMLRYKQAFIAAGCSPEFAEDCADAGNYEECRRGYENDPEGAAQEEMSYWEE